MASIYLDAQFENRSLYKCEECLEIGMITDLKKNKY